MRSNQPVLNTPSLTLHKPSSAATEMRAYDQLPRILRDALKSCPIDASAVMCLQEFRMSRNAPVLANEIT
jgi:hypothetical protein